MVIPYCLDAVLFQRLPQPQTELEGELEGEPGAGDIDPGDESLRLLSTEMRLSGDGDRRDGIVET